MQKQQYGFTLLEIVFVIAIIGVLAAVALPYYQKYQYRAKAAEIVVHLDKIRSAMATLESEQGMPIGSKLVLSIVCESGMSAIKWSISNGGSSGLINGVAPSDIAFPDLGVMLSVTAGYHNAQQAGQFKIIIMPISSLANGCMKPTKVTKAEAYQIAMAFGDIMKPMSRPPGVTHGSSTVSVYLNIR